MSREFMLDLWRRCLRLGATLLRAIFDFGLRFVRWLRPIVRASLHARGWRTAGRVCLVAGRVTALAALLAVLALGCLHLAFERVTPWSVAVKQVNWGTGRGIVERDFDAGMYFGLPLATTWHQLDRRTQFLSFAWASEGGNLPLLDVRTQDGNLAKVAVTIPYRIRSGEAHAIVAAGLKHAYHDRVRVSARQLVLEQFSALTTEELMDTDARLAACQAALERLNRSLAEYHVVADAVMISGVHFSGTYEKALQEHQLLRQKRLTDEALARRADQKLATELIEQGLLAERQRTLSEWQLRIATERVAGQVAVGTVERATHTYEQERQREAEQRYQLQLAEGELALARTAALREQLMSETLNSVGGRVQVARDAAAQLKFASVKLDSRDPRVLSPLDLDALVALLLGSD